MATAQQTDHDDTSRRRIAWGMTAVEVLLIVALFFVYAGGPPPATNEAHYLTRMKHFWNPDWCAGDLFLESPESQPVFQTLCGWPSLWLSLPVVAWTGRIFCWLWLAIGWMRLSHRLIPQRGWALLSAAIAILFWDRCHMAGEWVVGGFEAKVVAYACVLFALTEISRDKWNACLVWLGLATALHPLVGGWSLIAAALSWTSQIWFGPKTWQDGLSLVPGCLAATPLVLLGVLPALWLDQAADAETIRAARRIYVYWRLNHHLLFTQFPWYMVARHLLLFAAWFGLWSSLPRDASHDRLQNFVMACVWIAVTGAIVELLTLRNWEYGSSWMRYYWYRMTDSLLPIGMAIAVCRWMSTGWSELRVQRVFAAVLSITAISISLNFLDRQWDSRPASAQQGRRGGDREQRITEFNDWVDVCHWCRDATEEDALFLVPTYVQTFKWYGHRPEYVNWKDVPQGSRAIAEWWRRRREIRLLGIFGESPPSHEEIKQWSRKSGADFLIIPKSSRPQWLLPVVFQNDSYRIYRL